jgi:hypothetical protein
MLNSKIKREDILQFEADKTVGYRMTNINWFSKNGAENERKKATTYKNAYKDATQQLTP